MKKNEYVSPEMEVVEIAEQGALLAGGSVDLGDLDKNPDIVPPED